ncbi:MAG: 50S ribosomal protein L24 [Demequinaceae bacterium]|nr:50S ribosomal protein L24 [Demequinaceae bacterium]
MSKIKKGDLVVVISGGDRGQQGRVLEVLSDGDRVIIEGVHRVTKHIKPGTSQRNVEGGIIQIEAPVHVSNVMLVDPDTKRGTRVGYRTDTKERNGRQRTVRVRVAKRSGKDV